MDLKEGLTTSEAEGDELGLSWDLIKDWLDVDLAVTTHCKANGVEPPTDVRDRATLHREIIRDQLDPAKRDSV